MSVFDLSCWTSSRKGLVTVAQQMNFSVSVSQTQHFQSEMFIPETHGHPAGLLIPYPCSQALVHEGEPGERDYLVCTHASCIADSTLWPDTCNDFFILHFRPLWRSVWATGWYCSLWSTRLSNVLSRQISLLLVINKWSCIIKLSVTALSHDDANPES